MYDYLKRSDDYKEYCAWQRKKNSNPKSKSPLPKKFSTPKNKTLHHIVETYLEYGDVHKLSFTEFLIHVNSSKPVGASPGIVELLDIFKEKTDDFIDYFKKVKDCDPNAHELANYWQNIFKKHLGIIYLRVDHARNSTPELYELLGKMLKKKKKNPLEMKFRKSCKKYSGITSNHVRLDELDMYLKVFDLWKKTDKNAKRLYTMKDIIKKVGTKADKDKLKKADVESVIRKYRLYRSKAERIIKNVENGYFPGEYN